MPRKSLSEFVAKGPQLRVIIVARISTDKQDEKSLEDQEAYCKEYVLQRTTLTCDWHVISSQGSGEYLDRRELQDLEDLIELGQYDVVVCEDLGRICRRTRAVDICESCQDHDTRLIAINDNVDTAEENWRMCSYFAAMRHEQYNQDTARRIRRTQRNRFTQGGTLPKSIFGYTRPPGAKTDDQLQKDPAAEPIYREVFRRLEDGATFAEIADWLNVQSIPRGPSCRLKRWTVQMISRLVRNPLLKGVRERNRKMSRRINKTGRRRPVDAPPEDLLLRRCPHLAFFDEAYYDHVVALVNARNQGHGRPKRDGKDVRSGISRKRTAWPAQHATCDVCGRTLWICSPKDKKFACCSGALQYRCWNGLYVDVQEFQRRVSAAVLAELRTVDGFDADLHRRIREAREADLSCRDERRQELLRKHADFEHRARNLSNAIAENGSSEMLMTDFKSAEARLKDAAYQLQQLNARPRDVMEIPSMAELGALLKEQFELLISQDQEAQRLLKQVLPDIRVRPVESCDGRTIELQATIRLDLNPLVRCITGERLPLSLPVRELVVNLFDPRPYVQHAQHLGTVEQRGEPVMKTGKALGLSVGEIVIARQLYRQLVELGRTDPYVPMTELPERNWKCKRHLHPRYRFEPLPDADEGQDKDQPTAA
jgi:site-specific DNA recombinase